MPLVDKPLPELLQYQGRNPRPDDFDSYWDEALREMHAVDPQVELKPSKQLESSFAECFDLWFTGVRRARIHATYLRPRKRAKKCPAVLQFHGYSGNGGELFLKLPWTTEGLCVATLDCRGQGGLSEDTGGHKGSTFRGHIVRGLDGNPQDMLMRHIFLDTAQLARVVMGLEEVDAERVGACGGSQGGALTLACCGLEPKIKRAAPTYPFLCDYQRVWEMDLAKAAYEELTTYFRMYDPQHAREKEIFRQLGYIDIQFLAPRIRAEILLGIGLMDTVCPPSSQFAAYNKITSKKDLSIFPDFGHEGLPGFLDQTFNFLRLL